MTRRNIPELLAPVGGWQQLKAAVQNGADAVYMGGPLFNARIKAENFTHEAMKSAIDYAHGRNVKVYITINTLIKDSELEKAFSYVNELYGAGADAVILQDLGLARLVRKYLPQMPMHLSTQGTVYNKWAVDSVKALGFQRVVPARELSLEEIRSFTEECHKAPDPCEVEVFIHGALCMCYSGQCQMSRLLGGVNGRSGNRGLCAQPCRLPYENPHGKRGFFLSPKDICTVEVIPQLCEAGVDSFKIEGRLKSPQYVAVVTSVYRKYLDQYAQTGIVKVQAGDMHRLTQIFNRGGFSTGYLFGNPGKELLSGDSPKNIGVPIGRVKGVKKGSALIDVTLDNESGLSLGDGVEIRGKNVTGNIVTFRKELSEGVLRIGDIKERVLPGDIVYKVTDKHLNTEAEESYAGDFRRKIPVEMIFTATSDELPVLCIRESSRGCISPWITVIGEKKAERALKSPLDEARVMKQLGKLGDTVFTAQEITVRLEEGLSISAALINSMRREAAERLLQEKLQVSRNPLHVERLQDIIEEERLGEPLAASLQEKTYVPLELFLSGEYQGKDVIPYVLNVSKGNLDQLMEREFDEICRAARETGILIGNLGWIRQFQDAGVKVYGDYGLNVYNRQSRIAFEEMGVEILVCSHELEDSDPGKIPLMITEHPIEADWIRDRKGKTYTVLQSCSGDKYLIIERKKETEDPRQFLIRT